MSKVPDTPSDQAPAKRSYDARSRRERAARERLENQARVLAAARSCFLQDGFSGTKMTDIADKAGVALASLYRATPSKVDLVLMLIDVPAVSDDAPHRADRAARTHEETEHAAREDEPFVYPWIAEETDPSVQVRLIAAHIAEIMELVGPMWAVLRDAAATDDRAAEAMRVSSLRRAAAFEAAIDLVAPEALRTNPAESTDTLYALSGPELYLEMTTVRGWSHDRYLQWLQSALGALLLKPRPPG